MQSNYQKAKKRIMFFDYDVSKLFVGNHATEEGRETHILHASYREL